jgi:hypothetical protein
MFQKNTSARSPSSPHPLSRWTAAAMYSRAIASEEEPSFTMPSSVYTANVGPGTFTTTLQLEPSTFGSGSSLAIMLLGRRAGQCLVAMGPSTTNPEALEIFYALLRLRVLLLEC